MPSGLLADCWKLVVAVRPGMSVTKGTGHVGNTFVEVEVKRAWRKSEIQVAAEAVGMWEAGGCLRAFQGGVGREGKGFLLFLSFHTAGICTAVHSVDGRHRLQDELMTIESRQGKGCKLNVPVAIVDRLHANGFSA